MSYKSISLFNDIEDLSLRQRNRAVVMANMSEQYCKNGKISAKGAGLVLGYFDEIPKNERKQLQELYEQEMIHRGFGRRYH